MQQSNGPSSTDSSINSGMRPKGQIRLFNYNSSATAAWGRLRYGARQTIALIALGVLIGAGFNEIREEPLPWAGSWSVRSVAARHLQGLTEVSLDAAWSFHNSGEAIFLDARDPESYQEGHLPGALNIPPYEAIAFAQEGRTLTQAGMRLIAYCDGVDCALSSELARALESNGVPSVMVLVDGWSRWREAGYRIE